MFNNWIFANNCTFLGHGLSENKACLLLTWLGFSFFCVLDKICSTCGVVCNEFVMDDIKKAAASYYFATAKTHDTISEFTFNNFKDHPTMANEMVTFIFMSKEN